MFANLTDLSFNRTTKQAIGFYLAYFLLIILVAGLLGAIAGIISGETTSAYSLGLKIGNITAIIGSVGLSLLVVNKKKLKDFKYIFLVLLAGLFAVFLGALLGLIPAAYLTTRQSGSQPTPPQTPPVQTA